MPKKKADHANLDDIMDDRPVFQGGPGDEPASDVIGPAKQAAEPEDNPAAGGERTNEATTHKADTAADRPGSTDETVTDKPSETDKPRFTSHEEAEKGYRHALSEKTRLELELKEIKQKALELEKEKSEREAKAATEQTDSDFLTFAAERHEAALTEIDELDPEAEDYRKKAAEVWARAQSDIRRKDLELRPTGGEVKTPDPPASDRPAESAGKTGDEPNEERTHVVGKITTAGIAEDDPLFWTYAAHAPVKDETGTALDLDGQIAWAIGKTQDYRNSVQAEFKSKEEEAAGKKGSDAALRAQPMGRSAPAKPDTGSPQKEEPARRVSLDDAVEFSLAQRVL